MAHLDLDKTFDGLGRMLYRGVATQKFPNDYVMYQMIIHEVRPDLIIEIGTMHGGSALYFADLMETMGIEGGEVHTIDAISVRDRQKSDFITGLVLNIMEDVDHPDIIDAHPRIKQFDKGWENYDLANCEGFKRILVIDDASHIRTQVLGAMEKFKRLISLGSYLIIEDGNAADVCRKPEVLRTLDGGPLMAIHEFLSVNDEFRIDFRWCDMFGINSTFNTYGYLKKVKHYDR